MDLEEVVYRYSTAHVHAIGTDRPPQTYMGSSVWNHLPSVVVNMTTGRWRSRVFDVVVGDLAGEILHVHIIESCSQ